MNKFYALIVSLFFTTTFVRCKKKVNLSASNAVAPPGAKTPQGDSASKMATTNSQQVWLFHWTNSTTAPQDPQGYLKGALELQMAKQPQVDGDEGTVFGPGLVFSDTPLATHNQENFVVIVKVRGNQKVALPQSSGDYSRERARLSLATPWETFLYPNPQGEGRVLLLRKGLGLLDTSATIAIDTTPDVPRPFAPREVAALGSVESILKSFSDKWGLISDMVSRDSFYFGAGGEPTDFAYLRGWFEEALVTSNSYQALYENLYKSGALEKTRCAELLGGCLLITREYLDRPFDPSDTFQSLEGTIKLLLTMGGIPPTASPQSQDQIEQLVAKHWKNQNTPGLKNYKVLLDTVWHMVRQKRASGLGTW